MISVGRTRATLRRATARLDATPHGPRETYGEASTDFYIRDQGGGLCTRKKKGDR